MNNVETLDRLPEVQKTNSYIVESANLIIQGEINEENYKDAGRVYKEIDRAIEAWETYINPKVDAANKIHKELTKMRNDIRGPLEHMKTRVNEYLVKCDAFFEAKAAKEAQQTQEMLADLQNTAVVMGAIQLDQAGHPEAADKLLSSHIKPTTFVSEKIKPPNLSFRRTYYAEIIDLKLLLEAVLAGKVPMIAIQANMGFINNQARNLKFELEQLYPGLKVHEMKTGVAR